MQDEFAIFLIQGDIFETIFGFGEYFSEGLLELEIRLPAFL